MDEFKTDEIPIPASWPQDAQNMVKFLIKRLELLEQENRELRAPVAQQTDPGNGRLRNFFQYGIFLSAIEVSSMKIYLGFLTRIWRPMPDGMSVR